MFMLDILIGQHKGEVMKQERVDPGWAWTRKVNFWVGVKLDETVQLSGLVAFDSEGNVIGDGDVYAQSVQTFRNIEEALASAGATMADVVKITTYLTDMAGYQDFSRARSEIFPNGVPSSTAVATPALIIPELLVEVTAMAIVGSGS
jgi:2-iminobutanoate/2-iminopropanoate deaminase